MISFVFYLLVAIIAFFVLSPIIAVSIGLFFKQPKENVKFSVFTKPDAVVIQYDLPSWLKWYQNPEDGLIGDKRGWYWNTYWPRWTPAWFKMWWWSAIRNPLNYFKRCVVGIDMRNYTVKKLCGSDYVRDDFNNTGFQILYATAPGKIPRPMLYWVRRWGTSNRGVCVQIGWKIKLSHNTDVEENPLDYFKGFTFEPNPFKDIS